MNVLIVESDPGLGALWQKHMQRHGLTVLVVTGQAEAVAALNARRFDVIVLNLILRQGGALAVADLAGYRQPDMAIVFVTDTQVFSDGSVFSLCANACAFLQTDVPPEDLVAVVMHYGQAERRQSANPAGDGGAVSGLGGSNPETPGGSSLPGK